MNSARGTGKKRDKKKKQKRWAPAAIQMEL